jgi:DNA-nicking Smr family endonuclease
MKRARTIRWPSAEDLDLFHEVLADVTPLNPAAASTPDVMSVSSPKKSQKKESREVASKMMLAALKDTGFGINSANSADHTGPSGHVVGRPPLINKRSAARLQRGKMEIEGRIDLHGMTQVEARSALTGFVMTAHRHGRRFLLVITGKGRRPLDMNERPWNMDDRIEPGVLRRMVPRWLEEPPLGGCVSEHSPALSRHGGTGALYVLLKRRRDQ